jgi:hypothetical protein
MECISIKKIQLFNLKYEILLSSTKLDHTNKLVNNFIKPLLNFIYVINISDVINFSYIINLINE